MTTMATTTYAVSVGVADIRRDPDSASELVTQALMNVPVIAGEIDGAWTHVTLQDYTGWIRTNQLEEPIVKAHCQPSEDPHSPSPSMAVVSTTHSLIYLHAQGNQASGTAYLSTALPLLDTTHAERVQVALPGNRSGWLNHSDVTIRQGEPLYPRTSVRAITDYACAFLERPYLWGGTSWEGIDCSGFVQLCYRMGGYIIPRDADQQYDFLTCSVKREEMQEGDLIFFGSQAITHVAMALNNKEYIHAEGQNYNYVVINSFDPSAQHYYPRLDQIVWGIKRVIA